jgi:hypothetical protein
MAAPTTPKQIDAGRRVLVALTLLGLLVAGMTATGPAGPALAVTGAVWAGTTTTPIPVDTLLSGGPSATGKAQLLEHLPASGVSGASSWTQSDDMLEGIPDTQACPVSAFVDVRDPSTLSALDGQIEGRPAGAASVPYNTLLCDGSGSLTAVPLVRYVQAAQQIPHAIVIINIMGRADAAAAAVVPDLGTVLAPLGLTGAASGVDFRSNSLSAIGMVGLSVGEAWQVVGATSTAARWSSTAADIHGYFIRNASNRWQFAPMRWAGFDTRSATAWNSNTVTVRASYNPFPGASTATSHTVTLPATYINSSWIPTNGFQLLVLDRSSFREVADGTYTTQAVTSGGAGVNDALDLPELARDLRILGANRAYLVILSSIGAPFGAAVSRTSPTSDARTTARLALADTVGLVGGTPQAILDLTAGQRYSMVTTGTGTAGGYPRPFASESSPEVTPAAGTSAGQLIGALTPGPDNMYWTPDTAGTGAGSSDYLAVVSQGPTSWPHPATAAESTAFAEMASAVGAASPQALRDSYRTAQAANLLASVRALTMPAGEANPSAWTTMRRELVSELADAAAVHSWFSTVQTVVSDAQASSGTAITAAVARVDSELRTQHDIQLASDARTRSAFAAVSTVLTGLGGGLGLLGQSVVKDTLGAVGGAAMAAANLTTNPTESDYALHLDTVEAAIASRTTLALPNEIVALGAQEALVTTDWGRLSTLAAKVAAPSDGDPYYVDSTREAILERTLALTVEVEVQSEALAPFFESLDGTDLRSGDLEDWGPSAADNGDHTFNKYARGASLSWDGWPGAGGFSAQVAGMTPMFTSKYSRPTPLSDAMMTRLTGPADPGGDVSTGGLGVYKPYVFSRLLVHHHVCDAAAVLTTTLPTKTGTQPTYHRVNDDPGVCYVSPVGSGGLLAAW